MRLWRVGGYVQRVSALYGRKKGHRMGGLCGSVLGLGGAALRFGGNAGQAGGCYVEVVLILFYADEPLCAASPSRNGEPFSPLRAK